MFRDASIFDQHIRGWNVSENADLTNMFLDADLMQSNRGASSTPTSGDGNYFDSSPPDAPTLLSTTNLSRSPTPELQITGLPTAKISANLVGLLPNLEISDLKKNEEAE